MIRFVATILVGVQALLPPGTCLCQFVPFATARQTLKIAPAVATPPSLTAHTDDSCCSCPACRPSDQAATPPAGEQTVTDRETPHEHHRLPTPASPCSGCPVVTAGPSARAVILSAPEQAPLITTVHFVVPTVEVALPRADRQNLPAPTALPLFVRYCAFLI